MSHYITVMSAQCHHPWGFTVRFHSLFTHVCLLLFDRYLLACIFCSLFSVKLSCAMQIHGIFLLFFILCEAPELVLRKMINFADCTMCLDKRNASGKIEFYQDPLLYKCSFRTRLHFTYDNINSKIPSVIKVSKFAFCLWPYHSRYITMPDLR